MSKHQPDSRRRVAVVLAAAVVAACAARGPGAEPERTVNVELRNLTNQALKDVPVTFGQVFRKGDVPRTEGLGCLGEAGPAQVDVKRKHDDGSVRFAVVSLLLPELPAKASRTVTLSPVKPPAAGLAPIPLAELLKTDFDAVVALTFPDGKKRSASARKLLQQAAEQPKTWLAGPVATEWLVSGAPVDAEGEPDEDLNVQFQIRAYHGCRRVRVSVVVENCWDHWAGNIRYDAAVTIGGKEVFARKGVDHRRLSRWRKVFWWGAGGESRSGGPVPAPELGVAHDPAYVCATGALPNYDTTLELPRPRRWPPQMTGPRWQIMGRGSLTAYMPTTGGRPEIGAYPAWAVHALLTMDRHGKALVLANGDLAGSWPIHVRSRKTGRILTIDERPTFWLDYRGPDKPTWKPDRAKPGPQAVKLSPDRAHQPSLAYLPYLLAGDFYYLEEAYFWANYCLLSTWPHPRRKAEGILSGQIRGNAWTLRNVADAAFLAPESDPEAKYFDEKVRNNIADRAARMYGPPEYNKIGAWGIRTTTSARIQQPANPGWMILAAWENDYLIWSLHHLVELGYADAARCRDFMLRLRVGALTNAPDFDPMLAAPYRFVVGEQAADKKVLFYEDWKRLGTENARLSKPGLPNYGNSYAYSARAAAVCGADGGFPKAREALKILEDRLPNHRQVMGRDPTWAIVPRQAAK